MAKLGLIILLLAITTASAFYLPGVMPRNFRQSEPVTMKVNKLDSAVAQLPYDFYSLPFCKPNSVKADSENLGEILSGDSIESSLYEANMKTDEVCKILCPPRKYSKKELDQFVEKIKDEYKINMIVDNLPAGMSFIMTKRDLDDPSKSTETNFYVKGFPLGGVDKGNVYLHNHWRFALHYHRPNPAIDVYRIVGFEVQPYSVDHVLDGKFKTIDDSKLKTCSVHKTVTSASPALKISDTKEKQIIWTYDVKWVESKTKWASRWDIYLHMTDSEVHWFSIVNSLMVVLVLSTMIAVIMLRTLRRDLVAYNEDLDDEEEETGWKLVYSDVFRPPEHAGFLSVLVGTGIQVMTMTFITLTFAALGFLSPANRGSLMNGFIFLFVFMGVVGGYVGTRVFKTLKLENWKSNALAIAFFFPSVCFTVFFVVNLFIWHSGSSGAVPFVTMLGILILWFGVSVPLVYAGAYMASKHDGIKAPVRVNHIPRMIPEPQFFMNPLVTICIGGVLPFAAIFVEIFFIMSSLWLHQFYYIFGVLFVIFIILLITSAEMAIVLLYYQLCAEDYHWWWRSFMTSGASAFYIFLYSIHYFTNNLHIHKFIPGLIFFSYMFLLSFAFFLVTGAFGFLACYLFVHKIYGSLKVD